MGDFEGYFVFTVYSVVRPIPFGISRDFSEIFRDFLGLFVFTGYNVIRSTLSGIFCNF